MTNHEERLARNADSLCMADQHRTSWSVDEVEFLLTFFEEAKGDIDAEREVAEALGRTIEACRQCFYTRRKGGGMMVHRKTVTTTTETSIYIGAADDPTDQWWSADYYTK